MLPEFKLHDPEAPPVPTAAPPPTSKADRHELIERLLEAEPDRVMQFLLDAIRQAHEGPGLLSKGALAKRLDVSGRTIERMDKKGLIPRPDVRNGQFVRWRSDTIARWIVATCPPREKWEEMERLRQAGRRLR